MQKDKVIKFLVIGDLHGAIPKIHVENFDAIICPGDICGDDIRPYIKKVINAKTKNPDKDISILDFISPEELKEFDKISIEKGRKVLEKLNSYGKPVFFVPGNWDPSLYLDGILHEENEGLFDSIQENLNNLIDVEHQKIIFEGITIIGHGSTSSPEPMDISQAEAAKYLGDEEYYGRFLFFQKAYEKLNSLFSSSKNPIIFITHNVPLNTKLDKINSPGSYADNEHYGSRLARKLIDTHQPLLCIGGHIHEGYGEDKIKNTLCINSGFGGDVNTIITINVKKNTIEEIEFLGENQENH